MQNIIDNFDKSQCCGCLSCVNSCPKNALYKSKDEYGFIIPKLDKKLCINCGKCLKVCPYHTKLKENVPIQAYAAINKSDEIIKDSSSGGLFHSLATAIINENGTVYGAIIDEKFNVHHIGISKLDELRKMQKSKYVQSDLKKIYCLVREKIIKGEVVLFSGTPCQIAGLKSFLLDKEYDNLFCVDIVCHGVPCQDIYDDYLECLQKKIGKIDSYEFRTKKHAKNGMNCFHSYVKGNKRIIKNWPEDSFNYLYMEGLIYRDSCYKCHFAKKNRNSDITLCDYWSWQKYHHDDFKNMSTISGCIINTEKGNILFNKIKKDILYKKTEYDNIAKHNNCLIKPSIYDKKRELILKNWKRYGYKYIDVEFNKRNKKNKVKYMILRNIPVKLFDLLYFFKTIFRRK